jgi:hypothetical protein
MPLLKVHPENRGYAAYQSLLTSWRSLRERHYPSAD